MIASAFLLAALTGPAPTYVVERIVSTAKETRRISVFRDGTAVLATRAGEGQPVVVRRRLDEVTFRSIAQVVAETLPELRGFPGFEGAPGEATVELRLAPPGSEPLVIRLPVAAVPSVSAGRLQRALDDIDQILAGTQPGQQDLSGWTPVAGQRVLLSDGTVVTVLGLLNEGEVVHVVVGDGPAEVFYAISELRRRAVRLVAP